LIDYCILLCNVLTDGNVFGALFFTSHVSSAYFNATKLLSYLHVQLKLELKLKNHNSNWNRNWKEI